MLVPLYIDATPAIPPVVIPPAVPNPFAPACGFGFVSILLIAAVAAFCAPALFPKAPGTLIPPTCCAGCCNESGAFCTPPFCELITAPVCVGVTGTNCPFASTLNWFCVGLNPGCPGSGNPTPVAPCCPGNPGCPGICPGNGCPGCCPGNG